MDRDDIDEIKRHLEVVAERGDPGPTLAVEVSDGKIDRVVRKVETLRIASPPRFFRRRSSRPIRWPRRIGTPRRPTTAIMSVKTRRSP
jgi:hypothetical protein